MPSLLHQQLRSVVLKTLSVITWSTWCYNSTGILVLLFTMSTFTGSVKAVWVTLLSMIKTMAWPVLMGAVSSLLRCTHGLKQKQTKKNKQASLIKEWLDEILKIIHFINLYCYVTNVFYWFLALFNLNP